MLALSCTGMAQVQMPSFFSDGMVLQQKSNAALWGKASPGEQITIANTWDGSQLTTQANSSGFWKTSLTTPSYGGPYSIIIKASNTVNINNVMIGEVWLASGQSNMEMPMEGWPGCPVEYGPEDIASSQNSNIRIFMVERAVSFSEETNLSGAWKEASPASTPKFGATCYYFARRLQSELGIPVGIINTSWGGTPDESWIPQEYIQQVPEYTAKCKLIDATRGKADESLEWVKSHKGINISQTAWKDIEINDGILPSADYNDTKWRTMNLPQLWEATDVRAMDGIIWFRREIRITREMAGKDLVISLGPIDDMDITYYNDEKIGELMEGGYYQTDRIYTVPASKVKEGKAVIAVRVLDNQGGGGIYGDASKMKYYTKGMEANAVSLAGEWKYMPAAEILDHTLYLYNTESQEYYQKPTLPIDLGEQTPTCLYNAMVAPLAGYTIAGAIWYQGCSNVGRGEEYSRTFPLMIKAWREKWGSAFPFYFVQIAPWNYGDGPSMEIREAQRLALSVENTGMAVTMDIGNNDNIHPANKHEVGDRLARIALCRNYQQNIPYSGPAYKSQTIEGGRIVLSFDFSDGLYAKGGQLTGFEIAGKDGKFYPANAQIDGGKVIVSSPNVKKPVSARYLWTNTVDKVTLYNGANLPASPFQTTRCWK